MDTTTSTVLTGAVVLLGHWTKNKETPVKVFVGVGVLAVSLAAMSEVNAPLAQQFGILILVGAVLVYAIPIGQAIQKGTR